MGALTSIYLVLITGDSKNRYPHCLFVNLLIYILYIYINIYTFKWGLISVFSGHYCFAQDLLVYVQLTTEEISLEVCGGSPPYTSRGNGGRGVEEHLKLHSQPASSSLMHQQHHVPWHPAGTTWAAQQQFLARHRGRVRAVSTVSGTSPALLDSPSPAAEPPPFNNNPMRNYNFKEVWMEGS